MSTNDDEPTVEPVRRVRRRKVVIPYGSGCSKCGKKGETRVDDGPFGKYRRGTCNNDQCPFLLKEGEPWKWHVKIPEQCLLKEPG